MLFVAICWGVFSVSEVFASSRCALAILPFESAHFSVEDSLMQVEDTGNEILRLLNENKFKHDVNEKIHQSVDKLTHGIDHIMELYIHNQQEWTSHLHKKLIGLANEAAHIKDHVELLIRRKSAKRYSQIEDEPLLARADFEYLVNSEPTEFRIAFNKDIVEKVLWYNTTDEERRARAFLKAVHKTHAGGIKALRNSPEVKELRLVCKHHGNCRILGYMYHSTFFATVFMDSHNRLRDLNDGAKLVKKAMPTHLSHD